MSTSPKPGSSREGLLRQIKHKVFEFCGHTTAHGYGRVADAGESRARKWFWLLACSGAFVAFSVQLYFITEQYLSRPLKTRIKIMHDKKLSFPQVTICNINMIRKSKFPNEILQEYPELLDESLLKRSNKSTSKSSRANSNAKGLPDVNDLSEKDSLIERVLTSLAKIPEGKLINYGHQLEDMIMSCVFNYIDCLEEDMRNSWTHFWHKLYGNCYTFNKGMNDVGETTEVMNSSQPGLGLTLEINIEQLDYVSVLSQEAGIRVFIGGQREMPFPYEQGISVSPGFSTAIELRKVAIGRLDPFENRSCIKTGNELIEGNNIFTRHNVTYTSMLCKVSCFAEMMNERCGCNWYSISYDPTIPVCDIENMTVVVCVNEVVDKFHDGACNNQCKEQCREDGFKSSVSMARWPSRQYLNSLLGELEQHVPNITENSGDVGDYFLKLKIYYGELNYELIEEEAAYSMNSFWSDIGGLLGMWIGISVLTVVEVLELTATIIVTIVKTLMKKKSHIMEVKPQKDDNLQRF